MRVVTLKAVNNRTFIDNYRFFTSKLKLLKFLFTIFLAVSLAGFSSVSDPTDGKGKPKAKTEIDKKKEGKKGTAVESTDPKEEDSEKKSTGTVNADLDKSDSTYNSVNKYNFILYFIYKYKYGAHAESLRKFIN